MVYLDGPGGAHHPVPLLFVALIGRLFLKVNYLTPVRPPLGSMTDPPALAFAGSFTRRGFCRLRDGLPTDDDPAGKSAHHGAPPHA